MFQVLATALKMHIFILECHPGIKRPGREAYHSPLSRAEVKNAWSYICIPPIRLHSVVLN